MRRDSLQQSAQRANLGGAMRRQAVGV